MSFAKDAGRHIAAVLPYMVAESVFNFECGLDDIWSENLHAATSCTSSGSMRSSRKRRVVSSRGFLHSAKRGVKKERLI